MNEQILNGQQNIVMPEENHAHDVNEQREHMDQPQQQREHMDQPQQQREHMDQPQQNPLPLSTLQECRRAVIRLEEAYAMSMDNAELERLEILLDVANKKIIRFEKLQNQGKLDFLSIQDQLPKIEILDLEGTSNTSATKFTITSYLEYFESIISDLGINDQYYLKLLQIHTKPGTKALKFINSLLSLKPPDSWSVTKTKLISRFVSFSIRVTCKSQNDT